MINVLEVTQDNENQYLDQIAELEKVVLETMEKEGRIGQLFITGKEDISEYIHSKQNTVMVATGENGKVMSASYITQGQQPFTYNDITKYFKYGENYKQYIKAQYKDKKAYREDLEKLYIIKRKAFEFAKKRILSEHPEIKSIHEFLQKELQENGFHEKSELREKLNQYMSENIAKNYDAETQKKYEQFYWFTAQDIMQEYGKVPRKDYSSIQEYEDFMKAQAEYEELLSKGKLTIYEKPTFDSKKYYSANTQNSIELDTYITSPENRNAGTARILVYEGIKKHINEHFKNPNNKEIFLCSTLHRDNLSSKYVSEFFGLTDSLYVNRRQNRDREVHICKIPREKAITYLSSMSDKLAVLYGYNPTGRHISDSTKLKVLQEQLQYEKRELARLKKASSIKQTFSGPNVKFIASKASKTQTLSNEIKTLKQKIKEQEGDKSYGKQ